MRQRPCNRSPVRGPILWNNIREIVQKYNFRDSLTCRSCRKHNSILLRSFVPSTSENPDSQGESLEYSSLF